MNISVLCLLIFTINMAIKIADILIKDGHSISNHKQLRLNFRRRQLCAKKNVLILYLLVLSIALFSSCNGRLGGVIIIEESKADARIEQIISALKDRDSEVLKLLFSKKALDEANNFDNEVENLLEFLQGDIVSWERDGWASDQSSDHGKTTLMIRPGFIVTTDFEEYRFFLIDYSIDTIDPDNEGLYMLQIRKSSHSGAVGSWQERMRAGILIIE